MALYYVWDELNGTRESADEYDLSDPEYAAELYAEQDTDGNIDNVYSRGHVICVADRDGNLWRYTVTVDYDPVYSARLEGGHAAG